MKIIVKIREVAEANGIKTAYQLQKIAGLGSTTAARLYSNKITGISLDALGKVCAALECDAAALLVRDTPPRRKRRKKLE
jgi:DNA-binding Xre family transcriptional regulator